MVSQTGSWNCEQAPTLVLVIVMSVYVYSSSASSLFQASLMPHRRSFHSGAERLCFHGSFVPNSTDEVLQDLTELTTNLATVQLDRSVGSSIGEGRARQHMQR